MASMEALAAAASLPAAFFTLIECLTVWGVEPVVTHQTSWLEGIGISGTVVLELGEWNTVSSGWWSHDYVILTLH